MFRIFPFWLFPFFGQLFFFEYLLQSLFSILVVFKNHLCLDCGLTGDVRLMSNFCHMEPVYVHPGSLVQYHPKKPGNNCTFCFSEDTQCSKIYLAKKGAKKIFSPRNMHYFTILEHTVHIKEKCTFMNPAEHCSISLLKN